MRIGAVNSIIIFGGYTMNNKNYEIIDSVDKLQDAIVRIREAQKVFATYTQEQVDKIFLAAASAADKAVELLNA